MASQASVIAVDKVRFDVTPSGGSLNAKTYWVNRMIVQRLPEKVAYKMGDRSNRVKIAGYHLRFSVVAEDAEQDTGSTMDFRELQEHIDDPNDTVEVYPDADSSTKYEVTNIDVNPQTIYSVTNGVRDDQDSLVCITKDLVTTLPSFFNKLA